MRFPSAVAHVGQRLLMVRLELLRRLPGGALLQHVPHELAVLLDPALLRLSAGLPSNSEARSCFAGVPESECWRSVSQVFELSTVFRRCSANTDGVLGSAVGPSVQKKLTSGGANAPQQEACLQADHPNGLLRPRRLNTQPIPNPRQKVHLVESMKLVVQETRTPIVV